MKKIEKKMLIANSLQLALARLLIQKGFVTGDEIFEEMVAVVKPLGIVRIEVKEFFESIVH